MVYYHLHPKDGGKVMFSEVCVCPHSGGGTYPGQVQMGGEGTCPGQGVPTPVPPSGQSRHPPSGRGQGRYPPLAKEGTPLQSGPGQGRYPLARIGTPQPG